MAREADLPEWWMFGVSMQTATIVLGFKTPSWTREVCTKYGVRMYRPKDGSLIMVNSRDLIALVSDRNAKHLQPASTVPDERTRFALRGFPYGDGLKGSVVVDQKGVKHWLNDNAIVPLKQAMNLIEPPDVKLELGKLPTREEFQQRLEALRAKRGTR